MLKKLIKIVSWGTVEAGGYGFGDAENLVEIAEPTKKTFIKCEEMILLHICLQDVRI